jgi:hypothetical protein
MVILNFTLSEEGVAVLHDALACMFKFSDDVCLEARKDKVDDTSDSWLRVAGLTPLPLADPDNAQRLQVGLHLLLLRRQQILLSIQF